MSRYAEAHKTPQGAGDARPTALQIVQDEGLEGKLTDKVFLVTGTSSGIGIETARAIAATGAKAFLAVRNLEKGRQACADILEPGRVELLELDTSSIASVRACAKEFLSRSKTLNGLICNAGIMMTPAREVTADGYEGQMATNYLGHFLLFYLLRSTLLASSTPEFNSRVINVSSSAHQSSETQLDDLNLAKPETYTPSIGYGNSKTAQIWFSNYVDRQYGPQGLHALSLMPGGIATGLQIHMSPAFKSMMANDKAVVAFLKSPEQGAATTVYAALSKEWEGKGGVYLEDCAPAKPIGPDTKRGMGVAQYAYAPEKEDRLWKSTIELLGLKDE